MVIAMMYDSFYTIDLAVVISSLIFKMYIDECYSHILTLCETSD